MLSSMNHLVLDMGDPDIAKALKGCKPGEHVEFTVGGKLGVNGKIATISLDEVKYTGSDDESDEAPNDPDDAPATKKVPMGNHGISDAGMPGPPEASAKPPVPSKMAPAVAIVMKAAGKPKPKTPYTST